MDLEEFMFNTYFTLYVEQLIAAKEEVVTSFKEGEITEPECQEFIEQIDERLNGLTINLNHLLQ
jgi:hypothetical protein